jgi:type IV secretory pathway protease TraF
MTESFNNISSAALDKWDPAPTKKGKLMFVGPPGFACYFDSDKARFPTFIPFAQNARPTAC